MCVCVQTVAETHSRASCLVGISSIRIMMRCLCVCVCVQTVGEWSTSSTDSMRCVRMALKSAGVYFETVPGSHISGPVAQAAPVVLG